MNGIQKILDTFFDLHVIGSSLPTILKTGLPNTLILSVLAGLIGLVVGIFIAMGLMSRFGIVRAPCRFYVDILRGLPHILVVYLIGQGLPLAGVTIFGQNAYGYAALSIGVMEGAYMAEIFRSGFQSVDKGLIEASRSLGVNHLATLRNVVLPIGIRSVLPALTGQFILIIKGTALIYLLGLDAGQREMFAIAQDDASNVANLSPLVAAGLIYLAITVPMTYVINRWDTRMREGRPQRAAGSAVTTTAED